MNKAKLTRQEMEGIASSPAKCPIGIGQLDVTGHPSTCGPKSLAGSLIAPGGPLGHEMYSFSDEYASRPWGICDASVGEKLG